MAKEGENSFVASDDAVVNTYGFRVMTKGIDTRQFKKNPVMLFNHNRWGSDYKGPIGRWENVRVEDTQLLADPVFDDQDDMGAVIKGKVERGFIKGASVGIVPIETSNDPKFMLPGQKYPTVTKSKLVELSVCDIPSNDNALALYDEQGNKIELNEAGLVKLSAFLPQPTPNPQNNMNEIKLSAAQLMVLGLTDAATEADLTRKLGELKANADKAVTLQAELDTLKQTQETQRNGEITALVDAAVTAGKITAAQKEQWTNVLKSDFENGKALLSALTAPVRLTQLPNGGKTPTGGNTGEKTYDDYAKEGTLAKLKADNPEEYERLLGEKKLAVKSKITIA